MIYSSSDIHHYLVFLHTLLLDFQKPLMPLTCFEHHQYQRLLQLLPCLHVYNLAVNVDFPVPPFGFSNATNIPGNTFPITLYFLILAEGMDSFYIHKKYIYIYI